MDERKDYLLITPPDRLRATIDLPASKSISNRALIITALSGGKRMPTNISDCDDTRAMLRALRESPYIIDVMAAGTTMRFLTAYLCVAGSTHIITGTERMCHRPIAVLVDALRTLGADIDYMGEEGYPPLRITGKAIEGGTIALSGNVSSQYSSALLMIGPMLKKGLQLRLTGNVVSRPYIDMTLDIMRAFGAQASWTSEDTIQVSPKPYTPTDYEIESDWSAASYWYEMVALSDDDGADVLLSGLRKHSTQGDSIVAQYFRPLGVATEYADEGVRLRKCERTTDYIKSDLTDQPDLAQTLVATCATLGVRFCLTGLQSLKIKETDRIFALRTELRKLGYVIGEMHDNTLFWNGETVPPDTRPAVDTYDDHRMAMALAPCSLKCGVLRVNAPNVVSKSYPQYWEDLAKALFKIVKTQNANDTCR